MVFQISQPKLGQIVHVGGVLKTSGPADSKSVPGFKIDQDLHEQLSKTKYWTLLISTV